MRLVVVGDVDPAAAQAAVHKAFEGWSGGTPAAPAKRPRARAPAGADGVMPDKPTSPSSSASRHSSLRGPGAIALRVGTRILGSGFMGRLMANVRDKEGLTYGISASIRNDTFVDGDWRIEGNFAPALLDQGIASTKRQLSPGTARASRPPNSSVPRPKSPEPTRSDFATTSGMAGRILAMLNAGMPLSFVDEYPQRVAALTLDEVNGAIRTHIDPAKMVLVQAGTVPSGTAAATP